MFSFSMHANKPNGLVIGDFKFRRLASFLIAFINTLTFQSLLVTWCAKGLTFNNCTFCPHFIYVFCIYLRTKRLRWSRGSVLAFGTQVRGFKPDRSRWIFQGEKILGTPSFGGEVKPSVPCRRFTSCKRSLNVPGSRAFSGKIHRPFLAQVVPPFTTRVSGGDTWRCK